MNTKLLTFLRSLISRFSFLELVLVMSKELEIKRKYWENGKLETAVLYVNGKKEGLATSWYESGEKKSELPCKNGELYGLVVSWFEDGTVKSACKYPEREVNAIGYLWRKR